MAHTRQPSPMSSGLIPEFRKVTGDSAHKTMIQFPKHNRGESAALSIIGSHTNPVSRREMNKSIDFIDTNPISVQDVVRSNFRKTKGDQAFGITNYSLPSTDIVTSKVRTTKIANFNVPHFIDTIVKNKQFLPSPQAYETSYDWKTVLKNRGKFLKSPRVTSTEKILKDKILLSQPGPASYILKSPFTVPEKDKIGGKSEKVCAFIEEAMYVSH